MMLESIITLRVEFLDAGGYVATSSDIPGMVVEGRTISELYKNVLDVQQHIARCCEQYCESLLPTLVATTPRFVRLDESGDPHASSRLAHSRS